MRCDVTHEVKINKDKEKSKVEQFPTETSHSAWSIFIYNVFDATSMNGCVLTLSRMFFT